MPSYNCVRGVGIAARRGRAAHQGVGGPCERGVGEVVRVAADRGVAGVARRPREGGVAQRLVDVAGVVADPGGQDDATVRAIIGDLDGRVRGLLGELVPDLELPPSVLSGA